MPKIDPGPPNRDSLAYNEHFDRANDAIGGAGVLCRDSLAAFLDVLADYAIAPGDANAYERFIELARDAATSARDAST